MSDAVFQKSQASGIRPVLGVCGRAASGKNMACRLLRRGGVAEIDEDRVGHQVLAEKATEIARVFGDAYIQDTQIKRRALASLVFNDPAKLRRLEELLHPAMSRETENLLEAIPGPVCINAALLYRMGLEKLCTGTLFISVPDTILMQRLMHRDGIDRAAAEARLLAQKDIKPLGISAEKIIENTDSPEAFLGAVRQYAMTFFGSIFYGAADNSQAQEADVYPQSGQ